MKKLIVLLAVFMAACLVMPVVAQPALTQAPADAGVAKLTYGPNKWIDVHFLLQTQYQSYSTWDSAEGETDSDAVWSNSFRLRRARMILSGQVASNVTFFVETDDFNRGGLGNDGAGTGATQTGSTSGNTGTTDDGSGPHNHTYSATYTDRVGTFIQDAYVNIKVAPELQIAMGMILLPFMHHNRQSAVSLLGVDYNTTIVNLPITNVWRDTGVEFRGLLANGMIDYRVGAFQGYSRKVDVNNDNTTTEWDTLNDSSIPRVTGRVQINLADAEDGFFYSGNYLGKKKILSFGAGVDWQKEVMANTAEAAMEDYLAWTVDVTVDYPITPDMVLAVQGAYVDMAWNPATGVENSSAYFAQMGLLINNTFQPVLKYETRIVELAGGDNITTYAYVGLNYFINGHNANIKIEYKHPMGENETTSIDQIDTPNQQVFTLQAQIFI